MKRHHVTLLLLAVLALLYTNVSTAEPCLRGLWKKNGAKTLVIYSTNDMHGRFDNFAKVKSIVDDERAANPCVLLLSAGDKYTGNPIVDQYPDKGYPIVDLMNRAGYQYEPFGNHEWDLGQSFAAARRRQADFESVSANFDVSADNDLVLPPAPYKLFCLDGVRICLLGLSQASLQDDGTWAPSAHPQKLTGITFHDPIATALNYRSLRDSCDVFIALTHIGYDQDIRLAEAMPELDAIIGGHSHTRIDSLTVVNGVVIAQAECWLKRLAKTTLTLKKGKVVDCAYELIDLSRPLKEDAELRALIDSYNADSPLKATIAEAEAQFSGKEALSTMMTDALLDKVHADIALQNSGGVRIGQLLKGPITKADVFTLNPFCNTVYIYNMTPAELREMLLRSHRKASQRADLLPGGIRYTLYTHEGKATRVVITDMEGNPLDENRTYRVAMNSYVATSYTFPHADPGIELTDTDTELLAAWLEEVHTVAPQPARTRVVEE